MGGSPTKRPLRPIAKSPQSLWCQGGGTGVVAAGKRVDETPCRPALYGPRMRRLTSRQASISTGTNRWGSRTPTG